VSESLRVYVDFETSEDPIAGRLSCGHAERAFTGWLGLIAALETAIAGPWGQSDGCEGPPGAGDPRASVPEVDVG
jgi:hypothetical protein